MRCVPTLVAAVALTLTAPAGASPRLLPQPSPEPLGKFVRDARTIHVLKVKSVDAKGATFETAAALKGKPADAPFGLLEFHGEKEREAARSLFEAGTTALCFVHGELQKREGNAVAMLHVGTRWVLGISPIGWRGEEHWFTHGEYGSAWWGSDFSVTYDGPDEALREHVAAILAGREAITTARAPQGWDERGRARLWRVKAGLDITEFVMSDESPHFVGWGTGEADEVANLLEALGAGAVRDRVRAADDLAHLGKAARPALPKLRRALGDAEPAIALAAAKAVARLDADDPEAVEAIRARLRHDDAKQRAAAAGALADLGPRARAALPALLAALSDKDGDARANAADAVGRMAPGSPASPDAVAALADLLKDGQPERVRHAAVGALLRFGPHAHAAIPALREGLSVTGVERFWHRTNVDAVALLARFDPPPVELLADAAADRRSTYEARLAALQQLAALGPRARAALPTLLRMHKEPPLPDDRGADSRRVELAWALLDIDPEGAPAVVAPVLLEQVKVLSGKGRGFEHRTELFNSISALGRCGAAARPSLPTLLAAIDPEDTFDAPHSVSLLTRLLTPKDRALLPELRRRFGDDHNLELAKALLRLGNRDEALAEVTKWLESDNAYRWREVIRWLRQRPREAEDLAPALRQALAKARGAERVCLALTLWRLRGGEDGPRARALAGLDDLLAACEGESRLTGYLREVPYWSEEGPRGPDERETLGAAADEVYCRVQAASDPVATLARLLRDPDPYRRAAAVAALARAEPKHPDIVPALRRLLERHPDFLCHTADTLAALGPAAAPLAPLLVPNLRHPDESVYRVTDRVLRRIDPALAAKGWGAADVPGAVPADLGPLWDDLAHEDGLRADLAAWRLAGAGPRAVALLGERLRPPPALPPERVARLIADLDDENFATRERASAELAAGVESAAPRLRRALAANPSPESRRRLEALLAGLDPASAAEQRRRLRGVRLLEEMGGPGARALLRSLSRGDPRFRLTREAAAALRRLDPPPANSNHAGRVPGRISPTPPRRLAGG